MLAVIPLMAGAIVLTAFDNVFPSFFSIIMALWVLTNNIDIPLGRAMVFTKRMVLLHTIINYCILQ